MKRTLPLLALFLAWAGPVQARGILIPVEKTVPPLAMVNHLVTITIDKSEMGEGNHTALAMIVAEELDADWSKVKVGPGFPS